MTDERTCSETDDIVVADDGRFAAAEGIGHDLLTALVDLTGDGVLVASGGTVRLADADAAALMDRPPAELVGTALKNLFPAPFVRHVERIGHTGSESETESEITIDDPTATDGRLSATVRHAHGGQVVITVTAADGEREPTGTSEKTPRSLVENERRLLAEVSRGVAEAESFVDGMKTALESVCSHTQWAYGEAWIPAEDGAYLEQVVGHAAEPALETFLEASRSVTFTLGEGLPGRVWESATREWIPDASAEPEEVFHRTDLAAEVGLRAALGVPITVDDRVVAVLTFFLRDHRARDDELAEVVTDVAADLGGLVVRKRAEDALERERALLERIFETSPVGLVVVDGEGTVVRANEQITTVFGRPSGTFVGSDFEKLADRLHTGDGESLTETFPISRGFDAEESIESVELEFESPEGESIWVSLSAAPIVNDEDTVRRVIVAAEDITERKEREQSLRAFQEAVEHAGHVIYFTDTDGTIQYVNSMFERVTGYTAEEAIGETPNILNSGEHDREFFADLWTTIIAGDVWTGEVVNERKTGERYVIHQTIAPIVDESGDIERFVAINDEITEQKRRERTLREQRNSLERVRQILESHRPINREIARAGTREEIERLVCEQLTASEAYLFAWLGEYNPATGEITPKQWAGIEDDFVDDLESTVSATDEEEDIFASAVATGEVHALQEVTTVSPSRARRDRALEYGFQSQAAVPVVYGDTVLGVIGLYSARPSAFDKYEQGLLRELGERIGHAINAAQNRQLLQTNTVVELEFELEGTDSPIAAVTGDLGCRLTLKNVTPTAGVEYLCHFEVDGAPPETVCDHLQSRPNVEHTRVIRAYGSTGIVEATIRGGPVTTILEHGATVRSLEATDGSATLVAETTPRSDVQALITEMEAAYDGTTFLAKRTLDREVTTLTMTKNAVQEALTERQQERLLLAYHAGYFESPRDSTGEELADALGISSPTFYQNTREGVRKILQLLVDADAFSTVSRRTLRETRS